MSEKEKSSHPCKRCKKPISGRYEFCFECREEIRYEELLRDRVYVLTCVQLASGPGDPREIALRAWSIAVAAASVRKERR